MEITLPEQVNLKTLLAIKKFLYLPLLVVIIVISILIVVVIPNIRKIALTRNEVTAKSEELENLKKKASVLQAMDEQELIDQIRLLEEALPSGKEVLALFRSLDGLAADSNVFLGKISLNPGRLASAAATAAAITRGSSESNEKRTRGLSFKLESLDFSFRLEGPFEGVGNFLDNIERLRPLMRVISFDLVPSDKEMQLTESGSTSSFAVDVKLSISMFYAGFPATLGRIADPVIHVNEGEKALLEELSFYKRYGPEDFTEVDESVTVEKGREDMFAPF